jgi:hypothetical protein
MDKLSDFREIVGYSNEQLEKMTGYTRQGLNKGIKKIREPLQTKLRIILEQVIDSRISEETAAFEARVKELWQLKKKLQYDYEEPEEINCKVLQFAKGGE